METQNKLSLENRPSKQERFEKTIKPILQYVGSIGAALTAVAYIAIVLIMVFGFQVSQSLGQSIVFAVVNAVIGLIIMFFLKIQGVDFAKNLPANQTILRKFNKLRAKEKKAHSMLYFWITSTIKDIVVKALCIMFTTLGVIYIVVQASNNYTLLLLAVVNLIMFVCFGLMSLVKAYDFFNEENIPYLEDRLNEQEQQIIMEENKENGDRIHEQQGREDNPSQSATTSAEE